MIKQAPMAAISTSLSYGGSSTNVSATDLVRRMEAELLI